MVFANRLPRLELGPVVFRSSSMASIRLPPTLTCFSPYFYLHPEPPASVTSPLHLQPWEPRSSGRWDIIPPPSGKFCLRRPGNCRLDTPYATKHTSRCYSPIIKGPTFLRQLHSRV